MNNVCTKCRTGCRLCGDPFGMKCLECFKDNGSEIYDLVDGKCVAKPQAPEKSKSTSSSTKIPIAGIAGGAAGLVVLIAIIILSVKYCKKSPPAPSLSTANVGQNLSGMTQINQPSGPNSGTTLTLPPGSTKEVAPIQNQPLSQT